MTSRAPVFKALEFGSPDRSPPNLWTLDWIPRFVADELVVVKEEFPDGMTTVDGILGPGGRYRGTPGEKRTYVDEWGCIWQCGEGPVSAWNGTRI